jgi:hypothetical protein
MDTDQQAPAEVATCPKCLGPMPRRRAGGGRPAKYCGDYCRKADHRAATSARQARERLPRLREFLDTSLTEAEAALRRLHASGLDPDELMLRPGVRPELPGDVEYALRTRIERLRSAVREHREAVETAKSHPAGAGSEDDDE